MKIPGTGSISTNSVQSVSSWFPSVSTSAKLFATGATVGPVVDSLHNQCLLQYDFLPIAIPWPTTAAAAAVSGASAAGDSTFTSLLFASSWIVPPLLGFAYVVLGGILPRMLQNVLDNTTSLIKTENDKSPTLFSTFMFGAKSPRPLLREMAVLAVVTTAAIIKLSEYLQTHAGAFMFANPDFLPIADQHIVILMIFALLQWIWLDGTAVALLAASITAFGGPLSELPFVASHCWEYLPYAADYVPLKTLATNGGTMDTILSTILGPNYSSLALSSITGPCYFAVTMDSIALGRWLDSKEHRDPPET